MSKGCYFVTDPGMTTGPAPARYNVLAVVPTWWDHTHREPFVEALARLSIRVTFAEPPFDIEGIDHLLVIIPTDNEEARIAISAAAAWEGIQITYVNTADVCERLRQALCL